MTERLHIQEYLQDHDYADLLSEYGVEYRKSPDLPLVIFDYNMYLIPSGKKDHPIVRECRGITLDSRDHALVAKAFHRFFNLGEVKDEPFDFSDFVVQCKEDGSLIKIYFFENRWHINTRFSFGTGRCCDAEISWETAVLQAIGLDTVDQLDRHLNRKLTYICEFCSPLNRVVREYGEPVVFLLSVFEGAEELPFEEGEKENTIFKRPKVYRFSGVEEIVKFLDLQEETDPTFEGFVIRDRDNHRLKIKSKSYLKISYYFGKTVGYHPRHLIVLVHDGDKDELLTYYPNIRPAYDVVKEKVNQHLDLLWSKYLENRDKDKRAFHESVVALPVYSVLESLYKKKGVDATRDDLFETWIQNEDKVLRELFGVTGAEHNLRHKPNFQAIRDRNTKK